MFQKEFRENHEKMQIIIGEITSKYIRNYFNFHQTCEFTLKKLNLNLNLNLKKNDVIFKELLREMVFTLIENMEIDEFGKLGIKLYFQKIIEENDPKIFYSEFEEYCFSLIIDTINLLQNKHIS